MAKLRGTLFSMVFQDPMTALNPTMTIGRQLTEGMRYHLHLSQADADKRAEELLEMVGIESPKERMKNYPHQLSGGMRQRVVIAIALSCNPDLLICDEVMAGFYRTGKAFAFMNFDIKPDIITFAKGVTCGYVQLGGCIVSKAVAEYFEEHVLQCGLTYSGHTLACAAGVAALTYYKEHDIEGHVAKMHEIVAPFMDEMVKKHKCIGEARCIGLFGALEVVKNKETREPMQEYGVPGPVMPWIFAELKKRGFATFGRENFIEICPPLIITEEELKEYLPILDEVLTMVDEKYCD